MTQTILLGLGFAVLVPYLTWRLMTIPDPKVLARWTAMRADMEVFAAAMQKVGVAAHEAATHMRYFELVWRPSDGPP